MAQEPKVTPLLSKDLTGIPGKEALMITVDYPPGVTDQEVEHRLLERPEDHSLADNSCAEAGTNAKPAFGERKGQCRQGMLNLLRPHVSHADRKEKVAVAEISR